MRRMCTRSLLFSALLFLACLGFITLWQPVSTTCREQEVPRLEPSASRLPGAKSPHSELSHRQADLRETEVEAAALEIVSPPSSDSLAPVGWGETVGKALGSLAEELDADSWNQLQWETRARALAHSLGVKAWTALREAAADQDRPIVELVAAAELIRHLAPEAGIASADALPRPALDALREAFKSLAEDPVLGSAACLSLAVLGEASDRQQLLYALVSGESPQLRRAAAGGLQAAEDPALAEKLAAVAQDPLNPAAAELAMAVLTNMARNAAGSTGSARDAAVRAIKTSLHDIDRPVAFRQRAVAAMGSLGGDEARDQLLKLLQEGSGEPSVLRSAGQALAGIADRESIRELSAMAFDPGVPAERQLVAAETIARAAARQEVLPAQMNLAFDRLRQALAQEVDARKRRRAVFALAESGEPSVLPDLSLVATRDIDSSVRGAAVVVLGRLDKEHRYGEVISLVATYDPSGEVRAQAAQALEQSYGNSYH